MFFTTVLLLADPAIAMVFNWQMGEVLVCHDGMAVEAFVGDEVPGAIARIAETDHLRAQRLYAYASQQKLIDKAVDEDKVFFALATAIRMLLVTATVDRDPIRLHAPHTRDELSLILTGYLQPR